ncbi:MAG: hypothetical protein J5623_05620 [Clostridiales bacterium]|nr:hypothetical protein [Clostridiales bacterium]
MDKGATSFKGFSIGINGFLFALYSAFVCWTALVIIDRAFGMFTLIIILLVFAAALLLSPFLFNALSKKYIHQSPEGLASFGKNLFFEILFYFLPLAVLLFYYYAYYPGCFTVDSSNQYAQVISGHYNDWHPVTQTLFAFKLPLALTGGWFGSIVLFQVLCFSAVLGYSFNTVRKYTNMRYTIATMAFVLLNPLLGSITMFPWKDVSFAIGALLLIAYSLHVWFSKGAWLRSPVNTVAFILAAVLTTLFRHNAILFTGPLVLGVLLLISKKRAVLIALLIVVLCFGVKIPFYAAIKVEKPDQRVVETVGLPMTVIGAAVAHTPELLDEETLQFAYKIAPEEVWKEKYVFGSYQQVKFDPRTNNDVIEEYGRQKIILMMFRCFKNSPEVSIKALVKLTEASYTLTDEYNDAMILGLRYSDLGHQEVQSALKEYCYFTSCCFPFLYIRLGVMHLLLIVGVLSKCKLGKLKDWKKILFIISVFAYNYGTSIIMAGNELSTRFFFYTFPLTPLLLIFLFAKDDKEFENM